MIVLPAYSTSVEFPEVSEASAEGLLAIGGDLSPKRLVHAYRSGIFPWYNDEQPILWWSPDPRTVLYPDRIKVSRSLRKSLRKSNIEVSFDRAFEDVIDACAGPRRGDPEGQTWITWDMRRAYCRLFELGFAHSVETWVDGELAGGLYGVSCGRLFFGESMFSRQSDTSKIALVALTRQLSQWGFDLVDCQLPSDHVFTLGAEEISRQQFISAHKAAGPELDRRGPWTLEIDWREAPEALADSQN